MCETDRKNIRRREESNIVRCNRIIVGYVESVYPNTYEEALGFYEELNAVYPTKKDLRRTNKFVWMRDGKIRKKYYPRKNQTRPKDNMQLVIPLIQHKKTDQNAMSETTVHVETAVIEESQIVEVPIPPDNQVTEPETAVIEESQIVEVPIPPDNQVTEPLFPVISDEKMSEIIKELADDPDTMQLFDDFDIDIDLDTETPLERELLMW